MENKQTKSKIDIFFSSEQGLLSDVDRNLFRRIQNLSEGVLRSLLNMKDYGVGVNKIFIIQTLEDPDIAIQVGWKEIKLFDKEKQEIEIRLHCDWQKFTTGTNEEKEQVVFDNIIASIEAIKEVAPDTFNVEELISDFKKASVGLF